MRLIDADAEITWIRRVRCSRCGYYDPRLESPACECCHFGEEIEDLEDAPEADRWNRVHISRYSDGEEVWTNTPEKGKEFLWWVNGNRFVDELDEDFDGISFVETCFDPDPDKPLRIYWQEINDPEEEMNEKES